MALTVALAGVVAQGEVIMGGPHYDQIDFRYPDDIVEPLVPCPEEGVFPHPRRCDWYYRCFTRYGVAGFYWRSYFHCEPGTVFSDALDQCVWEGEGTCSPGRPEGDTCELTLEDCATTQICEDNLAGVTFLQAVEVCANATKQCGGGAPTQQCAAAHLYDSTNKRCIPETLVTNCKLHANPRQNFPDPPGSTVCYHRMGPCTEGVFCRNGTESGFERLCRRQRVCEADGAVRSVADGCLWDLDAQNCTETLTNDDLCTPNVYSDIFCSSETERCQKRTDCDTNEEVLECHGYFSCRAIATHAPPRVACPDPSTTLQPSTGLCFLRATPQTRDASGSPEPCVNYDLEPQKCPAVDLAANADVFKCSNVTYCHTDATQNLTYFSCENWPSGCQNGKIAVSPCAVNTSFVPQLDAGQCIDPTSALPAGYGSCPDPSNTNISVTVSINCERAGKNAEFSEQMTRLYCSTDALWTPDGGWVGPIQQCTRYYQCVTSSSGELESACRSPAKKKCAHGAP